MLFANVAHDSDCPVSFSYCRGLVPCVYPIYPHIPGPASPLNPFRLSGAAIILSNVSAQVGRDQYQKKLSLVL